MSLVGLVDDYIRRQKARQTFAGQPIEPGALMVPIRMTVANLDQMTGDEIVDWAYRFVGAADIERSERQVQP